MSLSPHRRLDSGDDAETAQRTRPHGQRPKGPGFDSRRRGDDDDDDDDDDDGGDVVDRVLRMAMLMMMMVC